jgi:hypothetical protein
MWKLNSLSRAVPQMSTDSHTYNSHSRHFHKNPTQVRGLLTIYKQHPNNIPPIFSCIGIVFPRLSINAVKSKGRETKNLKTPKEILVINNYPWLFNQYMCFTTPVDNNGKIKKKNFTCNTGTKEVRIISTWSSPLNGKLSSTY